MKPLRWGILSTAGIARKNWRAIHDSGNAVVSAVASRDAGRSRDFINSCQQTTPFAVQLRAFVSYEELIASSEVDAVYIPVPTGLRKEWVLRAAAAGKHVLCEKPCGLNASDVREMVAACERNQVQFMDGVMFMHNARMQRVRELLDDGSSIGRVKRITSMFTFAVAEEFFRDNIRVHSQLEPAGCLGDLGWYCIRFSLWAMNWKLPREVTGRVLSRRGNSLSPGSVPTDFSGELIFDDESSSGFFCSFLTEKQQWADVSGAKGQLRLVDFVHPLSDHEPTFEYRNREMKLKVCDCAGEHTASRSVAQDANMFRNFTAQVQSGRLNRDWPQWALLTQQVMDGCLESAEQGKASFVSALG
jgi:predicted dehydrogenase